MTMTMTSAELPKVRSMQFSHCLNSDLDRSSSAQRKRFKSASAMTGCRLSGDLDQSLHKQDTKHMSGTGPFSKLKNKLGKMRSIDKASTQTPEDHMKQNGADVKAVRTSIISSQVDWSTDQLTVGETKPTSVRPFNDTAPNSEKTAAFQRSFSIPDEPTRTKISFNFHPGDGYEDFPCKYDCPQPPRRQRVSSDTCESPSIGDVLKTLSGPPTSAAGGSAVLDDRSPLLDDDAPRLDGATATSFDNIAAVTDAGQANNASPALSTANKLATSEDNLEQSAGNSSRLESGSPPRLQPGGKKRKGLSIMINKDAPVRDNTGMKQLSAAEEKKIDEAIQLANSFARLGAGDNPLLTPRSPSASSKESLDSPAAGTGSHVFRFGGLWRRAPRDEKKTFVDGLALTCDTSAIFTQDAQAAYNQLVAMSPPASAAESMTTKLPSSRQFRTHRQLSESPAPRPPLAKRLQRSSLSESDQGLIVPGVVPVEKPKRLNSGARSQSLSEEPTSGPSQSHRIELKSMTSSDATITPVESVAPVDISEDNNHTEAPPPPPQRTSSPPPALPPRVPLRKSTVNTRPRQRQHPLTKTELMLPAKQRSMSEAHHRPCRPVPDVLLPRRVARSTGDGDANRVSLVSSTGSESEPGQLDTTRDSDDSVFGSSSSDEQPPDHPAPPPPRHHSATVPIRRLNASELGFHDASDVFWNKRVEFDHLVPTSLSRSEQSLLEDINQPLPGRYDTSDAVSYEDLMEFALDEYGPRQRRPDEGECDEVRLMRKLLKDVSVDECVKALSETQWNVHNAIKLIKLNQLINIGVGDKQLCKQALLFCRWNVQEAASYLLTPPQSRRTPDITGV